MCKSMNQAELKAMLMIVKKLSWNDKPASEVVECVGQMVRNQQALELDCIGECDDFEETLLSIALWDPEKIISTQYVSSYQDLAMWDVYNFCDEMGITPEDYANMLTYYNCIEPEIFEQEDYEEAMADEYYYECLRDLRLMTSHC